MLYHAQNGTVQLERGAMDYISFGTGPRTLVMLPGLGDGLKTVRGSAIPFALLYRAYAKDCRVYVFSRKVPLEDSASTRTMARDQKEAMDRLGISRADVLGVSQGGMVAQYLAIDHPDAVNRLVLAVTAAKANDTVRQVVGRWTRMAEAGDYKGLMIDTAETMYTEAYLKHYRPLYPILGRVGKPKEFHRFLVQANACVTHDACPELSKIKAPTLVIGGACDRVVGKEAAGELAEGIPGSRLFVYPDLGHGAYEEAKDFDRLVLEFLNS